MSLTKIKQPPSAALRLYPPLERLTYFAAMREDARVHHDLIGGPGPFSEDPILAVCRFCNINREHDAVTRWVAHYARPMAARLKRNQCIAQMLVCRIFNEPTSLVHILPVEDIALAVGTILHLVAEGKRVFRGAYMMPVHGNAGKGRSATEYFLAAVGEVQKMDFTMCESFESVAAKLLPVMGLGEFLVNQVVADLRYIPEWQSMRDWETFVLCGPGSRRGIDRLEGNREPSGNRPAKYYSAEVLKLREQLRLKLPEPFTSYFQDPNNLSNTLCEFDKYERALWTPPDQGVGLRKYHGTVTP